MKKKIGKMLMLLFLAGSLTGCGMFRDFDASGYTEALLAMTFQGEVEEIQGFDEDKTKKEWKAEYEAGITSFVDNITYGMDMSMESYREYTALCKRIFSSMRYSVGEAKKVSKTEYQVPVEIEASDVFARYIALLEEGSDEIWEKTQNGEYKGTEEEIQQQMMFDVVSQSYALLETSFEEMSYGGKEEVTLTVKSDDGKRFFIEEKEITKFTEKILGLDAIQD